MDCFRITSWWWSPFGVTLSLIHHRPKNVSVLGPGNYVSGWWALGVVLRYGPFWLKLVKILTFGFKVPLWYVLTEKLQLRSIGTPKIYSLFGGRMDLMRVHDCNGSFISKRLWARILWGNVFARVTGKTESGIGVRSIQLIGRSEASPLY